MERFDNGREECEIGDCQKYHEPMVKDSSPTWSRYVEPIHSTEDRTSGQARPGSGEIQAVRLAKHYNNGARRVMPMAACCKIVGLAMSGDDVDLARS